MNINKCFYWVIYIEIKGWPLWNYYSWPLGPFYANISEMSASVEEEENMPLDHNSYSTRRPQHAVFQHYPVMTCRWSAAIFCTISIHYGTTAIHSLTGHHIIWLSLHAFLLDGSCSPGKSMCDSEFFHDSGSVCVFNNHILITSSLCVLSYGGNLPSNSSLCVM